jgi:hypothetical protein
MTWPFPPSVGAPAVSAPNAPFNGTNTPTWQTGVERGPNWVFDAAAAMTTTATRLYYYPMYFDRAEVLAGVKTLNGGAGDNGETYRVGLYFDNGATGGPGTLAKDFGQVTLTAASAIRTLSNSYTMIAPGWYWIAVHHNTACSMAAFRAGVVASGVAPARNIGALNNTSTTDEWQQGLLLPFFYVDTAYGALAATAVVPTNSAAEAPAVRIYK